MIFVAWENQRQTILTAGRWKQTSLLVVWVLVELLLLARFCDGRPGRCQIIKIKGVAVCSAAYYSTISLQWYRAVSCRPIAIPASPSTQLDSPVCLCLVKVRGRPEASSTFLEEFQNAGNITTRSKFGKTESNLNHARRNVQRA